MAVVQAELKICFLGSRRVTRADTEIALQPQEWNVLALLGIQPGRVLTSDKLQTELFGEAPLETGDRRIRTAMSKLRTKLGEHTVPRGSYVLNNGQIDTVEFVQLARSVGQNDPASEVIAKLGAACELWPAATKAFAGDHWPILVEDYRAEVELLRGNVDLMLAEALVVVGDFDNAAELLWPAFLVDAVSERRATILARSLALNGERDAALRVLADHYQAIEDQLDLGPSHAILTLQGDIEYGSGEFASRLTTSARFDAAHIELLISLGRAMRLLGDPEHLPVLLDASRIATAGHLDDHLGRVVIELSSHGRTTVAGTVHAETGALLDKAVGLTSMDPAIRAEMLASCSTLLTASDQWERGQQYFREAVFSIKDSTDRHLQVQVLLHTHLGASDPLHRASRNEAINLLGRLARDDPDEQWEAAYLRFWQSALRGNIDRARSELSMLEQLAPNAVQRRVGLYHLRAAFEILKGNKMQQQMALVEATEIESWEVELEQIFDEAEHQAEAAYAFASRVYDHSWARHHHVALLFAIRVAQNRAHEYVEQIGPEVDSLGNLPNWRAAKAYTYADAARTYGDDRRRAQARALLDELGASNFEALHRDLSWTGALWLLARTAAMLEHAHAAPALLRLLGRVDDELAWIGHCTIGSISAARDELVSLQQRNSS